MLSLFLKTLSREFYRQHLGLLAFAFYLLFGTVEGSQLLNYHLALLHSIAASTLMLAACCVLWLLYALKCQLFVNKQLQLEQYSFIQVSAAAVQRKQYISWAGLYSVLLMPVLIYVSLVIGAALWYHNYLNAVISFLFAIAIVAAPTRFTYRKLTRNLRVFQPWLSIRLPSWPKPQWTWPLIYIWKQQTLMLVLSKLLSFILFKAVLWMFADVGPDVRVAQFGLLAALISHSTLVIMLVRQDAGDLAFIRSLPQKRFKTTKNHIAVLFVLFLPEMFIYAYTVSFDLSAVFAGLSLAISTLFCMQVIQYKSDANSNFSVVCAFTIFVTLAISILAGQLFPVNGLQAIISIAVYNLLFYDTDLNTIRDK